MRLMLIFHCILGLQSKSIYLTKSFVKADISRREKVFIELNMYLKSDGGKCDIILIYNKSLYGQAKSACLWYESCEMARYIEVLC